MLRLRGAEQAACGTSKQSCVLFVTLILAASNPALMYAAFKENDEAEFLCAECSPPLQVPAD